jgi:predicted nucleic-acid-binding protein
MIAFDTNVVIRLMVEDDETQARRSQQILGDAAERGERVLVTDIVLCELEWVLEAAYKVPRGRILAAVQALAADARFTFENPSRIVQALDRYQHGRGDLADYLLGLVARDGGAGTTYTFDRGLRGEEPFTVVR